MRLNYIAAIGIFLVSQASGVNASSFGSTLRSGTYMPHLLDADHPEYDASVASCIKHLENDVLSSAAEGIDDMAIAEFHTNKTECLRVARSKSRHFQVEVIRHMRAVENLMLGEIRSVSNSHLNYQRRLVVVAAPYVAQDSANPEWVKSISMKMKELGEKHLDNLQAIHAERNTPLISRLIPILRLNVEDMSPPAEFFSVENEEFVTAVEMMIQAGLERTVSHEDYRAMLRDMPELNNDYEAARRYDDEQTQLLNAEFEAQFGCTG